LEDRAFFLFFFFGDTVVCPKGLFDFLLDRLFFFLSSASPSFLSPDGTPRFFFEKIPRSFSLRITPPSLHMYPSSNRLSLILLLFPSCALTVFSPEVFRSFSEASAFFFPWFIFFMNIQASLFSSPTFLEIFPCTVCFRFSSGSSRPLSFFKNSWGTSSKFFLAVECFSF